MPAEITPETPCDIRSKESRETWLRFALSAPRVTYDYGTMGDYCVTYNHISSGFAVVGIDLEIAACLYRCNCRAINWFIRPIGVAGKTSAMSLDPLRIAAIAHRNPDVEPLLSTLLERTLENDHGGSG